MVILSSGGAVGSRIQSDEVLDSCRDWLIPPYLAGGHLLPVCEAITSPVLFFE